MILYRPVSLQELALIYDGGMKVFPARLPQQPIFYPVFQLEYARQTASEWNAQNGEFAGYVTQFKVEDEYLDRFEEHAVGGPQYQELWIPAEEMEEFNRHIVGHIQVVEAYFGDGFQGFVPDTFGMQGKNAVEQFTLLANSYLYQRMDFYLEIKRNHKAIFLNYLFWRKYEFRNPGLKEKILQAIKEGWLTSFPKIPLPMPPPANEVIPLVKQTGSPSLLDTGEEAILSAEETDLDEYSSAKSVQEDNPPATQTYANSLLDPVQENSAPTRKTDSHFEVNPVHEQTPQSETHFLQGIKLGISGQHREAIAELSRAVQGNPDDVVAQTSLGVAFHRLGEDERALSCYEAALRIDPTYAESHYFRANILYSRGDVREALAGYTVAIGLKPELIEGHQKPLPEDRLTDYSPSPAKMYRIAKPAHRILELNKTLETNPGLASVFKERAAEYSRLRNHVQAIVDYSSYLEIQPQDAGVLHLRGQAYDQIGQVDRAMQDYRRAIAINPQLSDDYINRGVALGQMGHFRQSAASLTEAIHLSPGNPNGYYNRGMAYFQQGDYERAIDDFSNVIRLSPGDEDAYYWRGISYEQTGGQREAIADYRRFLELSRNEDARREIEGRLSQWTIEEQNRSSAPDDMEKKKQVLSEEKNPELDIYGLIVALGERALNSMWFGSDVECYGEKAEELYALTDHDRPIEGHELLRITSGIRQTIKGDFQAFEPGAVAPWIFIRAWEGSGFYIEIEDPKDKDRLKGHFQSIEEVDGASPPYQGLFIRL